MDTQRMTMRPPLFISSRLMAAVRIPESGGTIHITPAYRDPDGRLLWRYVVEDSDGQVLDDATDLRSGSGDGVDPRKAMAALVGFLVAAADAYRRSLYGHGAGNDDLFPPQVYDWAYEHDDTLAALALALDEDPTGGEVAVGDRDAVWWHAWDATGCADCAAAASQGRWWGPDYCPATHRPHTPPAGGTPGGRR